MTGQEYLKQVTIGKISELSGRIELKEYDPAWNALYETERQKICKALNRDGIVIEHVGSTSVPGLCAKPIIDILLLVEDSSDEGSYVPELEKAGYVMRVREPDWYGHRMLKGVEPEVNLHVFPSVAAKRSGCLISEIGYRHMRQTVTSMRTPRGVLYKKSGNTFRIMPMPSRALSVKYLSIYPLPRYDEYSEFIIIWLRFIKCMYVKIDVSSLE